MKRNIILAAVAIIALCVFSCKKSENPEPTREKTPSNTYYKVPEVEDMNAYLKGFKQKMQTRGNDDTMALDEAAWHLSSVANYDFGDVVSNYKNFHYDTLYYNINVENGRVSLSDLNALYATASADITDVFQNLNLENKHIRFIGATINNDGSVVMSILSTYDWINHQWYFSDPLTLYETLGQYFDDDYTCDYDEFTWLLDSVLNELVAYHPEQSETPNERMYLVFDRGFVLPNLVDPYDSPHYNDYRIFYEEIIPSYFTQDRFFYCVDSYAGLATTYCPTNKVIISFNITQEEDHISSPWRFYHEVTMIYGDPYYNTEPVNPED